MYNEHKKYSIRIDSYSVLSLFASGKASTKSSAELLREQVSCEKKTLK